MGLFTPFIIPYAFSGLGMTEAIVGLALAAKVLSNSLSNLLWSRLSAVRGNRYLLLVAGSLEVLALLLVLSLPLLPRAALGSVLGLQFDLPLVMLLVVMAAAGAGESGQFTAHMAYLLDLAPERTRSVYMATYYLVVLPMCFMPLATATIIGAQGRYMVAFALGAVAMAVTMLHAPLPPPRRPAQRSPAGHRGLSGHRLQTRAAGEVTTAAAPKSRPPNCRVLPERERPAPVSSPLAALPHAPTHKRRPPDNGCRAVART